jgi:pimeloyl-ACP methyl ester carboxylesterase
MKSGHYLQFENLELEYLTYGTGEKILFAFHGFGLHASDFEVFEKVFGRHYTMYCFNLFHHGESVYPEERIEKNTFTKHEFREMFSAFIDQLPVEKVSVMGYSLGGKIALMFPEIFPEKTESVWLFAPDGIKKNIWYYLATNTWLGRHAYKYFLEHPELFFAMVHGLEKTGVINEKLKKFALNNLTEKEQRDLVYRVWLTFKDTNPNMRLCIQNIRRWNIPVYQFFGKNDKVIKPKLGDWLSKKIGQEDRFHILPMGHRLLNTKTAEYIEELGVLK